LFASAICWLTLDGGQMLAGMFKPGGRLGDLLYVSDHRSLRPPRCGCVDRHYELQQSRLPSLDHQFPAADLPLAAIKAGLARKSGLFVLCLNADDDVGHPDALWRHPDDLSINRCNHQVG